MIVITILVLVAIASICKAVKDTLKFHYYDSIFLKYNGLYWNPDVSWRNKYKINELGSIEIDNKGKKEERFWLSTTALVFLTDAWHLFSFIEINTSIVAITIPSYIAYKGNNIIEFILIFLVLRGIYALFFNWFYEIILNRKIR